MLFDGAEVVLQTAERHFSPNRTSHQDKFNLSLDDLVIEGTPESIGKAGANSGLRTLVFELVLESPLLITQPVEFGLHVAGLSAHLVGVDCVFPERQAECV